MPIGHMFRGSLLTRHFVTQVLTREFAGRLGEASVAAARRRFVRCLRAAHARLGPASSVRAICEMGATPLFAQVGYTLRTLRIERCGTHGDLLIATLDGAQGVTLRLIVSGWQERLDRVWRPAVQAGLDARRRWCLCFNGHQLRVVDVDRPYARRFLELDLYHALEDERGFALLWALLRPEALASSSRGPALLDQIIAACDAHGGSVRAALQHGVRQALASLAMALARAGRRASASASAAEVVAQALTMIYRLLFLLFAEARALVPIWHPIYRDSYSIAALHALAERRAARGLWPAVQAISRLAHDGCTTDDLSVTAFNGQLFSPEHTPLGEHVQIASPIIADVLDALMTTPARGSRGRERITYADLGVEQLGTVYERVLDYAPHLEREIDAMLTRSAPVDLPDRVIPPKPEPDSPRPRTRGRATQRSSARRKESGSFYTPRSMADYLVRVTLGPLVTDASPDDILRLRVLDPAMGSGAFLVSACRFLAQAYDLACERDGCAPAAALAGTARNAAVRAGVRRHIARHCLFGIDLNPMAVQLARLSLWLTTMTRDAPLTFLDHHLRVGDSLVGASLDDLVRRPPPRAGLRCRRAHAATADLPLFSGEEHARVMREILPARTALTGIDDSAATVREKERVLASLARAGALARWLQLADVWCASWFASDAGGAIAATPAAAWPALADYLLHGHTVFPQPTLDGWLASIRRTADRRRFFHWTLEFPEAFFDEQGQPLTNGGFDAIVGNPPWDMIRNDARADERSGEPIERESAALSRFVRESGVYPSAGDAHFNCYQLFVERSLALLKRGGRFGLVLPWGIAADHGSARLRRRLMESCDVDTLVSFENSRAIFPIHRSTRFALMTGMTGRPTRTVCCRFGERDPAVLDTFHAGEAGETVEARAREKPALVLSVDLLRHISGETLAFPDAREPMDIAMLERLQRTHPALAAADGWHVKFGRELDASADRALLQPAAPDDGRFNDGSRNEGRLKMPVIDGKHLRPFAVSMDELTQVVRPTHRSQLLARLPDITRPRLAFRDIASPTNRLTLIVAILPAGVVSTHTISCLKSSLTVEGQWCLCALLNSFVANYLVRLRVSTHVTVAMMERMPVPRPLQDSALFRDLAGLAEQLSHAAHATRHAAYARVQALAARAYELSDEEFSYLLTTFPLIEEETKQAALELFRR